MKLAIQLAYRNLMGAGLKTWLNVGILAFTFLLIVFYNGFMDGWNAQAMRDSVAYEFGEGHYYHKDYDPKDPFSIKDGHGIIQVDNLTNVVPILIRQGSVYPDGRMMPVLLKGIPAKQSILDLPTSYLQSDEETIPAIIGKRFAKASRIQEGDDVTIRWRDQNGSFDAVTIHIAKVFDCDVPTVDAGQIWLPLYPFRSLTGLDYQSSMFVINKEFDREQYPDWNYKSQEELLKPLKMVVDSKKAGGSIMYVLLLGIALLAIFDTQVLSIFRRQKEIGTYVSLGMTRSQVVKLFTVEGAMYSIMAVIAAIIVGVPLFYLISQSGITIPQSSQTTSLSISEVVYPKFTLSLIATMILLVVLAATMVSYLPSRKIAKMDPVQALKGKIQ